MLQNKNEINVLKKTRWHTFIICTLKMLSVEQKTKDKNQHFKTSNLGAHKKEEEEGCCLDS